MKKITFTKMVASGNDFVIIEDSPALRAMRYANLAKKMCNRKYGAGADGLLVLDKLKPDTTRMRIFNADGSEAEMCGNGARCAALWIMTQDTRHKTQVKIKTKAGIIEAKVGSSIKIKLSNPKDIALDVPIKINNRNIRVNFINTGVPHAVIFTQGLGQIDVFTLGRNIRYHKQFLPRGTNVDFVEVLGNNSIQVRTYERGVEDETLACGTGSTAAALIFALKSGCSNKVSVLTQSKEILSIYYSRQNDSFRDVWLEGSAKITYKGEYNV